MTRKDTGDLCSFVPCIVCSDEFECSTGVTRGEAEFFQGDKSQVRAVRLAWLSSVKYTNTRCASVRKGVLANTILRTNKANTHYSPHSVYQLRNELQRALKGQLSNAPPPLEKNTPPTSAGMLPPPPHLWLVKVKVFYVKIRRKNYIFFNFCPPGPNPWGCMSMQYIHQKCVHTCSMYITYFIA